MIDWHELHSGLLLVNQNKAAMLDFQMKMALEANGLVENAVQKKHCKGCGQMIPDFYYLKITPAGRLFMGMVGLLMDRDRESTAGQIMREHDETVKTAIADGNISGE